MFKDFKIKESVESIDIKPQPETKTDEDTFEEISDVSVDDEENVDSIGDPVDWNQKPESIGDDTNWEEDVELLD